MEYDLHDLAYKSYMEDAENHFQNRDTYITGFKAGYQKAIQVQAGVIKKNAEFTAEELYAKLDELIDKHPSTGDYAEDGRYTYPGRWHDLLKYIREKQ